MMRVCGRIPVRSAGLALLLSMAGAGATAQDRHTVRLGIGAWPERRPGVLLIEIGWGAITVTGGASTTPRIQLRDLGQLPPGRGPAPPVTDLGSMVRIERHGDTLAVRVVESVIDSRQLLGVAAEVPGNVGVVLRAIHGGTIEVSDVVGDHEVTTAAGDVTLDRVAGSAIVDTRSGSIRAVFTDLDTHPLSFATANGSVEVTLPPAARLTVHARSFGGNIVSELDLPPPSGIPGGKRELDGPLHGGGPPLQVTTLNGTIILRTSPRTSSR